MCRPGYGSRSERPGSAFESSTATGCGALSSTARRRVERPERIATSMCWWCCEIPNTYQEIKRMGDLKMDLYERYGLYFSFHPYTQEAYQDLRRPFIRNVHTEGILLL